MLCLEDCALGYDAVCHIAPKRHQELARQRHYGNPPNSAAPLADPLREPATDTAAPMH